MARGKAMPRCCLDQGQPPKPTKSRYDSAPTHKSAVGVYARISAMSADRLVGVTRFLLPEVIASHGLEYETLRLTGGFRPKESPRVTLVPVAETGKEMTRQASGSKSEQYRLLQGKMLYVLGNFARYKSDINVTDFDWYGDYNNVFVAKLDPTNKGFKRLLDIQNEAKKALQHVGIQAEYLYEPDHISLFRQGTRRNPLESDEEHKANTVKLFTDQLNGESVTLSGLSLITAANKEIAIKDPFARGFNFSNEIG